MDTIKKIQVDGVDYDIQAKELTKVTYAELKEMRDNGSLAAGHLYRITDYEFTTVKDETKSAGHVFDIIVLATSENQLSELARAIQHEGDTYFDGNDLGAWELWYDLDNDVEKYAWADAENGKGVIYRMIDEKLNDCPYDFKNALFYNTTLTTGTTTDKYYYTFSYVVSGSLYDGTVEKQVNNCYGNSIGVYSTNKKKYLNLNVFINTKFMDACCSNTFWDNCYKNTFGNNCYKNTFGNDCSSNKFGNICYSNTFVNDCYNNTFGDNCRYNTFGVFCRYNTFGDTCYSNTFGNSCEYNTFGFSCYSNTFGNDCSSNKFGSSCDRNTFGDNCYKNTFGNNCLNNTFGSSCRDNTFGVFCSFNKFGSNCYYNTFGSSCFDNTFGSRCEYNTLKDNTMYREANGGKTTITFNEEYFDDGSSQLVPIKHPDLSTQPSILPYKFMGQYVYEQLIPHDGDENHKYNSFFLTQDLAIQNPMFLEAQCIMSNGVCSCDIKIHGEDIEAILNEQREGIKFVRVVYTSMPEEGDYYGYNSY